jgi:hypothetical protein
MAQSGNNANSQLNDWELKSRRLCVPFSITASATPANKVTSTGLPSVAYLSTQGNTATAAALDPNCNFSPAAADSSGTFGVLLYGLGGRDTGVDQLFKIAVDNINSAGGYTLTLNGNNSTGITISTEPVPGIYPPPAPLTEGENIAFTVGTGVNLATTTLTGVIIADYHVVQ